MFEYVRTHQRLMQFILLLFIVPSFALVGISSYMRGDAAEATLAKVSGQTISQREFDDALRDQMNKMRQRMGNQFDEATFNTPENKQLVLENLLAQHALKAAVANAKLSISDAVLHQNIVSIPGFTLPDGSFDTVSYKNVLAAQGMTPLMYETSLRHDLAQQQLVTSIQTTAIASKTLAAQVLAITTQEREIQAVNFKASDYAAAVKPTDAMLLAYYNKNAAKFSVPESAKIEYLVLSADSIAAQIPVSDEEIDEFYEQNAKSFTVDEQRRASHILIKLAKDASSADKAQAKAKAAEVLALVRKQPGNFAQLAKQYSQDEGSAAQGGDLDYFGKGMMLKPFEAATYQLKLDEVSDLVESDYGFHIIRLTGIKPAAVKPLAQVKDQIKADLKKQKANKKFSELAETFTNTVYEQSSSLQPAADKLKLTIQTADKIGRTPTLATISNPILANDKLIKAIFSDDAIKNKRNTEALELGGNTLVSARIVDYKPASSRPFAEVKDIVTASVIAAESEQLAISAGAARLASLNATPEAAGFSEAKLISRTQQGGVPPMAFEAIMKADTRKLPVFVGVTFPGQGYSVYRINKVEQPVQDARQTAEISKQIENVLGSEDLYTLVEMLKQQGDATITKPFVTPKAAL